MRCALLLLLSFGTMEAGLRFRPQEIQKDWGVVYAVTTADVNRDGKPDIVAINPTELAWFENPTWTKHVVLAGGTKKDNVCLAPLDIDGDGKLDFALGADWQPANTASGGSLQWVSAAGKLTPIGEEPTLHRIRWGDVDSDGKAELVVAPLHGRGTKGPGWEGQGARILVYRIPANPATEPWPVEVADDSLHIVHNLIITDGEIWTASKEGVHTLKRGADGKWSRRKLADGAPGEIKLGRVNRVRTLATVEPWHGNKIVVYSEPVKPYDPQAGTKIRPEPAPGLWARREIETGLTQAHALGWGDLDGDGSDELAAGWRSQPKGQAFGVAVYKRSAMGDWIKTPVDDGVAVEDLAVEDLNGDGRAEIVAVGRSTGNVRIYWNESRADWPRHVVGTGFSNFTANAADFTGDGKVDVISNDLQGRETYLFAAPDWKRITLHRGLSVIHGEVMDVDGDGDLDYVGAQYSPGVLFWLERPKNALREPWPYHEVDNSAKGGVHGIHGMHPCDVDGDGRMDIIVNSAQPKDAFPNSLAWFSVPRGGKGNWPRHVFARGDAPGLSHYMGCGDVNGDGKKDIAAGAKIADGGNWFRWWEQPRGGGEPWKMHEIASRQEGATNILIADLNGDKKPDFAASRGHGRGLVWYEAPGWTAHEVYPDLVGPHSLVVGDIDADGDIDIASAAKDSGIVALLENDGKGIFKRHHLYEDQSAYDIRMIDMDGDGDLDLLVAGQESQNVVWLENPLKQR